jgi:dTDP-4-dehydrorhamnose reductase
VVQVAIDAGAELKLNTAGIEAISAADYPLPAPRPMNSRMATSALQALLGKAEGSSGLMPKLHQLQQSWQRQVTAYVQDLVLRKFI